MTTLDTNGSPYKKQDPPSPLKIEEHSRSLLHCDTGCCDSKDSKDNASRKELLWTNKQEELFFTWQQLSLERSYQHNKLAKRCKRKYRLLGLISIILPTILSGVTQYYSPAWLLATGFISSGILNGLSSLFNYGSLYQLHNEYAAKYEDFEREISTELIKPKANRGPCDVYLKRCEMILNSMTRNAPDL